MRVFGELKRAILVCAQKILYVLTSISLRYIKCAFWRAKTCCIGMRANDMTRVNEHSSWIYPMRIFGELKREVWVCAQNILYLLINISLGYIKCAFSMSIGMRIKDLIRINERFSWVYQMRVFGELKCAVLVCAQMRLYALMNFSLRTSASQVNVSISSVRRSLTA